MGNDVFGTMRYACRTAGCQCEDYICMMDAMSEEERAATVVHHPRNHPGYVLCTCGHDVRSHNTDAAGPGAHGGAPLASLRNLLEELRFEHLESVLSDSLLGLAEEAEALGRPGFMNMLKARGVESLRERQSLANAVLKARREGRIPEASV